ncbi:MAG: RnfABCDGE type electron transport complex subunit G [Deltaproteobacteria bacterium]|nr:RnfABCDGE type electron transport complex subunit G [Deltaproteobacteria bacterium]
MNNVTKMFLNLVVIGAVSGAILAAIYHVADPMIQANKEKELKEAIFVVLPDAKDYKVIKKTVDKEEVTIFEGIDAALAPVGIAFKADGGGFQGNVGVMVGLNMDYLHLKGIRILDQVETPGLGNRISEPAFEGQFKGIEATPRVEYIKNRKPEKPNQIQAITGATISSNAVVTNINNAVAKVLKAFPKEEVERMEKEIRPASKESKEAKHGG